VLGQGDEWRREKMAAKRLPKGTSPGAGGRRGRSRWR
jgi:hypothetical protein